ncbi:MAG: MFS transporter [Eubacteriales bacterium]
MKLSKRIWASFLIIGLTGQFAWTIENMYFNVYLYNTISTNPNNIALMVASSAIVATLTTLVMGAFSDKLGRRKPFISLGYIFWGLSTMAFGLISVENIAKLFPAANAVAAASAVLIIMDCVMTFFGSTANDAAFNAYVTDTTTTGNRGRVESVLAVLPLMSMLIIFGAFDSMTQKGEWQKFFNIFGAMVTVTGLVSLVLLKDSKVVQSDKTEDHYLRSLVHGFKPSVIRNNPSIYLALTALGIFSIAVQVFFPYLIIYMQHYLQIDAYAIVLGIVLIVASVVSVIGGGFIDKAGKMKFVFPSAIIMFAGLIGMFFARSMVSVIMIGSVMMSGYMLVSATLSAIVRDHTPVDKVGHFQGIRMIFAVLLPMVIGPFIGAAVIINSDSTYVDLGVVKSVPTPSIFLASAAVLLLVTIPILLLRRRKRNENDLG